MALGSGASGTSRGGGVDSRRSPKPASRESRASREASPDSVLNDSSDRPLELAEDLADAARSSDGVDERDSGSNVEVRAPSPSSHHDANARNGEDAETNHLARFPSVASLGTPRLTRPQPRARRPFAAPTQTDDERDEDEGDEEEDEAECADDASGSGAFANASRDEKQPTTRSFAAFAPSTSPHPYLPGVLRLDVPGLRLDGPCHRSCCVPNATREWLRAHPTKTPALAPPLAPGGERVAVCKKTFDLLKNGPYAEQFLFIEPRQAVSARDAKPFDCAPADHVVNAAAWRNVDAGVALRSARDTKGEGYSETIACEPGSGCC